MASRDGRLVFGDEFSSRTFKSYSPVAALADPSAPGRPVTEIPVNIPRKMSRSEDRRFFFAGQGRGYDYSIYWISDP
jgi:hypothetical protein